MRNYILLCLFIIPIIVVSQEYEPTLVEGNRWDVTYWFGMGFGEAFSEVVHCDTIIDQTSYSISITYERLSDGSLGDELSRAYLREDIIEQQIFRKESVDVPERLIIDYSLEVGDAIQTNDDYYIVENVFYEDWYGEDRKTLLLDSGFKFIEGVGISNYGIFWGIPLFGYWNFENIGDVCENSTSNQNVKKEHGFDVSPNPTYGQIKIKSSTPFDKETPIEVLDINGRIVLTSKIKDNVILDFAELDAGMFIVIINGIKKKVIKF